MPSRLVPAVLLALTSPACGANEPAEPADETGTGEGADSGDEADAGEGSGDAGDGGDTEDTGMPQPGEPHPSCLEDEGVILPTPAEYADALAAGMTRMATVVAPNGGEILIFAQDQVEELQIRRARNLLRFFLEDAPGTTYGADKTAVANAMANNGAILMMPNGEHQEGNEPNLEAQPLYWSETPVEGSAWYMTDDWDHRDAAPEEIFHLVHDTGIGTYLPGALPDYQAALDAEAREAMTDGRWGIAIDPFVTEWLEELEAENSLAQEYIASVIDSYYGLWAAWDETPGGMWGLYIAKDRAEIGSLDPDGGALLEAYLPPMLTYEARLDPSLTGTFSLQRDEALSYTHKSQYLVNVTLTGSNPSGVLGNAANNTLRGNDGDNVLDGAEGDDAVVYCEPQSSYGLTVESDTVVVTGPQGRDELRSIERIYFADAVVNTADL